MSVDHRIVRVKFIFNNISIPLYTKNNSEQRLSVSLYHKVNFMTCYFNITITLKNVTITYVLLLV